MERVAFKFDSHEGAAWADRAAAEAEIDISRKREADRLAAEAAIEASRERAEDTSF